MQTPEEMLRRMRAARPGARAGTGAAQPAQPGREVRMVATPLKPHSEYSKLMKSHDRMGTRHLG